MRPSPDTRQLEATVEAIARVQTEDGCIPWFAGGHADPWNHVEAAMALDVGGRGGAAEHAYRWLASTQRPDGAWASGFKGASVVDSTLDANFCAYVATGCWHHFLTTGDVFFLEEMWATVERAVEFTLALQRSTGEIMWARDGNYRPWPGALLTSCSCIHLSLRCALAIAREIGEEQPDWELSLIDLADALSQSPQLFEPKERFAMDWYYPVLGGVVAGESARARMNGRWDEFVVSGFGVRCVRDQPWITTGETSELILALDAAGMEEEARALLSWLRRLRAPDGAYWTGATYPDWIFWPAEKPTWGSAAAVLAHDALHGVSAASGLFRGEGLPVALDLSESVSDPL